MSTKRAATKFREPARPFLDDNAYQKFRGIALMTCDMTNGHCGYASAEQFRKAAWYSIHPTLEETGRRFGGKGG